MPAPMVLEFENLLREHHVEPVPQKVLALDLKDENDLLVVTSAFNAAADVLVTADKEILRLKGKPLRILTAREFWPLASDSSHTSEN